MISAIYERTKTGVELTQSEFDAVKKLVRECAPGYAIAKTQKRAPKIPLGQPSEGAVNPLTGYQYGHETGVELIRAAQKNGWCGQFAGKAQWETLGRIVKDGEKPVLSYLSIYKKLINIFSYEQTT